MPVSIVTENYIFGELLAGSFRGRGIDVQGNFDSCLGITRIHINDVLLVHMIHDDRSLPGRIQDMKYRFGEFRTLFLISDRVSPDMIAALNPLTATIIAERDPPDALISAITLAELGYQVSGVATPCETQAHVSAHPAPPALHNGGGAGLSDRETAILDLLVEGLSNKSIAIKLGITDTTVKVHLRSIYRKIGVSNRTQAAMWASQDHAAAGLASLS